MFMSVLPMYS
ncbi:hypothetical protein FWK35_00002797 [Aphis craccivora]|uniref:Uncharacterized protein n=1 Tax=Aphis craccivora TaxID=307492 RepID=A0A6G0Z6Y9_APHCR|nr:hypothetical protein FWK35_00002797 [Aphis craccivora]